MLVWVGGCGKNTYSLVYFCGQGSIGCPVGDGQSKRCGEPSGLIISRHRWRNVGPAAGSAP